MGLKLKIPVKVNTIKLQQVISVAFDPGFANGGWAIIAAERQMDNTWKVLDVRYGIIETRKPPKKQRGIMRVSSEDQIRIDSIVEQSEQVLTWAQDRANKAETETNLNVVIIAGLEWFTAFQGAGGAKTGIVLGYIYTRLKRFAHYVFAWLPSDTKREICGNYKASKEEVFTTIGDILGIDIEEGHKELWGTKLLVNQREHVGDALSLAYMNFDEYKRVALSRE